MQGAEDRKHLLITCPAYKEERRQFLEKVLPAMDSSDLSEEEWLQLMLDPSKMDNKLLDAVKGRELVYRAARMYIWKAFRTRTQRINNTVGST